MTDPEAQAQHPSGGLPDMNPRTCLILSLATALILVALTGYTAPPSSVEQVPRLTKEAVKEMLGKPDVVIVDIRYIKQYEQSDKKLPGAVFVQPEDFDEFVKNHPQKDKTFVLY
jgi:predicted sulfurtransferase